MMFTHHIITSCLIITSYAYYQTKVGNAILCLADVTDILLSVCTNGIFTPGSFWLMLKRRGRNYYAILDSKPRAISPLECSFLPGS
jgi:hypothetical protein